MLHKHFEFVKHHNNVQGNIQYRCRRYQNGKCQARLKTKNNEMVSDGDPQHNHDATKKIFNHNKQFLKYGVKLLRLWLQ